MSTDIENISNELAIHLPENPASTGHGASVDFTLKNEKHLKFSNWQEGNQPTFTLTINDPISLGLEDSQEQNVEQFIDDIILACNILLKRVTFSKHKSESKKSRLEFKEQKSTCEIHDTPTGKAVVITEHLRMTDRVSISIGTKDELDENEVLEILDKIRKMRSGNAQSSLNVHNFQKSLNEYDGAMEGIERLSVFKHLFSALELATNCDNMPDRSGTTLDNEVIGITGIGRNEIEDFRNFNSRSKHKDRTSDEETKYQEGLSKLGSKINPLRNATQKIIQNRFNLIS